MHACAQYVMIAVSTLCYEILLPSLYTQPRRKISDVKESQFSTSIGLAYCRVIITAFSAIYMSL